MQNRSCLKRNRKRNNSQPVILLLSLVIFCNAVTAQLSPYGPANKITAADFSAISSGEDTAAGAVVLADIGSTEMVGNDKGNFSLRFQRFCRVLIFNNRGFDAASITIPLYFNKESREQVKDLGGTTYNLEEGSVAETKLDTKKNVFTEKLDKNHQQVKFTLPAVKAGSIIEFKYTIHSDFIFNLQPWTFQGIYPRKWSEYNFMLPGFYAFIAHSQGSQQYFIKSEKESVKNFLVSMPSNNPILQDRTESYNISANVVNYRWVMKNVPALKEEPFISSLDNYFSKIEFQLSELKEPFTPKRILSTWPEATKELLTDERFGAALTQDNSWLVDKINSIITAKDDPVQRTKKIFEYIRDHFTCTSRNALMMTQTLEGVYKNKSGTVSELNMLLVAMLRTAGLSADPVILSLRPRGNTHAAYPLMDQYNYVICRATPVDKPLFLDASVLRLGFNRLIADCYNGHARVVNEEADPLEFSADSLKENKQTSVFAVNDGKGKVVCTMNQRPGYYQSLEMRNEMSSGGKVAIINEIKKELDPLVQITGIKVDSLHSLEEPTEIAVEMEWAKPSDNIIYLDPMFGQGYKQNPFKSANRFYPVEMPYATDEMYQLEMEVPAGYTVEELPKPLVVKLNEKEDGLFEYRVSESGGHISLRSRLSIKRAVFSPEEYNTLREFFNQVVKKQAEQIVFKKK